MNYYDKISFFNSLENNSIFNVYIANIIGFLYIFIKTIIQSINSYVSLINGISLIPKIPGTNHWSLVEAPWPWSRAF